MGLDCLPRRCPDVSHRHPGAFPDGLIHQESEHCPFQAENFPIGIFATCCSLRGKGAAYELDALGQPDLANAMYSDMTCEEAAEFAGKLRQIADRLEQKYAGAAEKPHGADWGGGRRNPETGKIESYHEYTSFEDALKCIREAARWYEKLGSLGFGVNAWS